MGKTNRDKNKFIISATLDPKAHIKAAEQAKTKPKSKRPVRKSS